MGKIKKSKILTLIVFFAIILGVNQCKTGKQKAPPKIDPAFTGYIAGFTSGVISNESTIRIELREKISDVEIDQPIEENLISFSPKIEGETYWIDNRTLEFRPKEILPSGKLFDAKFHLSKIIEVPSKLKTLKFQFQTMKQGVNVYFDGIKVYDQKDLSLQKLQGKLTTIDYANDGKVEKILTATQNGKDLAVKWEHAGDGKTHNFTVDSILRTESKGEVILQWNGELIDSPDEGDHIYEIPPLGDFKVLETSVTQQPEQYITIYFSDPLKPNQELIGLIHLNSGVKVKLVIDDNEVKVYPASRQSSENKLIVEDGIRNIMGYQLKEKFEKTIKFTSIKPDVQMIGKGVILPSSNGLLFPFKAVNLNAVNVKIIKIFEDNVAQFLQVNQFDGTREIKRAGRIVFKKAVPLTSNKPIDYGKWNTFSLDLSNLINAEPGAIYRVNISFDKSQSLYPCSDSDDIEDNVDFETNTEDESFDGPRGYYNDYYYDYYSYNWNERDNPCKKSYYMHGNHAIVRNVLASDLGIIAKGGNSQSIIVAVTDLVTSEQLAGVDLEIYNYQNQLMAKGSTDAKGMATIELNKKPFLLIAKKGSQRGYLRLDDGSALSLSMFDVGGQKTKKGVKGYIYGERGVWRPGDSIYVSFILEDKNKVIPEDHPVVFELYTPDNQLYQRKVKTNTVNNFYDFRTATDQEDPTGNWLAKVKVGGAKFTKTLKIETVKPNRLKIKIDFDTKIFKKDESPKGELEVKWLHGAIAKSLKADIEVVLSEGKTKFEEFPGFNFDDPIKEFESTEDLIFDGYTNENGKATISPKFYVSEKAPGMLKANFKIRAFEKGGDFSVDRFTMPYSPYSGYVGLKVPKGKGWNGALFSNEPNLIPVVTVDENGNPTDRKNLKIEVFEIRWRWWWEHSEEDDLARYIRNRSSSLIHTGYIDTKDGKAMYELNLNKRSWGRKLIRITDPVTKHSTGQLFYTTYKGWWNNAEADSPGGAEMLSFSTDKKKYNVGEEVKIELPASEKGKALVSIESGSKVIHTFWADISKDNHSVSFQTNEEMTPNVYVHIAYIQPHNQVDNDLPIRLYGVQSISVEDAKTHLHPQINMPDVLEPEKNVTIKISEANGKKMTYTLAIVDEGLLDLTRFQTPNAWKYFYAREALGVKTWDMYKYVIGAFTGEMSGLLAIGGDEEIEKKGGQKANRFKPVVKFLGPFELKSGENSHTFKMPNYVGSVRTMVVAGNKGAYGKAEKATPVKKPLMVIATLPRVVGPTETVKLPVTLFAMDPNIKNVSVEVKTNDLFSIEDEKKKSVLFEKEGDKMVTFNLKVTEKIGVGKVKIIAKSGKEKAEYDIELDVRLPNPMITNIIDGSVESGKTWTSDYNPVGIIGTNNGFLEVSSIPPLNLGDRLRYLIRYPHGCIEQTTSSVFPQLHLSKILDLNNEKNIEIENNIIAGINRLKLFQVNNGGLSYWPGEYDACEWGTNYAGHFMLEAKALGYNLPAGFLKNWIKYQTDKANNWTYSNSGTYRHYYNSYQLIQAYRLYTLALAGKPAFGAMNRMRENSNITIAAKWKLAAAYHIAGRKEVAKKMIKELSTVVKRYKELSYSYGSTERDQAMILETLSLMKEYTKAKPILDELIEKMASKRWYSTQTTAYTLLAITKFIGNEGGANNVKYKCEINGNSSVISSESPISQVDLNIKDTKSGKVKITNTSEKTLFIKIQLEGIPLTGDPTSAENGLNLSVKYLDLDENTINPAKLEQGTDFMAEVTIHHPGLRNNYKEMALTQIFPSGWEIRNLRMDLGESVYIKDEPRYQDIRDDRVYSYFDINKNGTKKFRILLNAAYLGEFYLPTVYCEAMYDNEINARKAGKWVKVIKPGDAGNFEEK